jgi:hypothetical protein
MPKPCVPARGGAMPTAEPLNDPSRRALLSAIPAAAIGVAALAPAARALAASKEENAEGDANG